MKVTLQFTCSNATTQPELALELEMSLMLVLNATFDKFVIYAQVSEQSVSDTQVLVDNVGMFYHDYDELLTSVINAVVYDFNTTHAKGIDLTKNTTVKFVAGLLRQTLLTPFEKDEFLFGGFRWISDL